MFAFEKNYPHKEDKHIFFTLIFVKVSIILGTSLEIGTLFNLAGILLIVIPASSIISSGFSNNCHRMNSPAGLEYRAGFFAGWFGNFNDF